VALDFGNGACRGDRGLQGLALIYDVGGFRPIEMRHRRHEMRSRSANGHSIPPLEVAQQKGRQLLLSGLVWEVMLLAGIVATW